MSTKHYTLAKLISGFFEALLGEKGFVYTLMQFVRNPGGSLRSILAGQLGKFNEPIRFLLYSVTLAALAMNLIGVGGFQLDNFQVPEILRSDEQLEEATKNLTSLRNDKQATSEIRFRIDRALADLQQSRLEWLLSVFLQWINVFLLIAVPVYSLGTYVILPRGMNFAEHLVLNAYIYGVQCCLAVVFAPVCLWSYTLYNVIYMLISQFYQLYAWQQIFRIRSWKDWLLCGILVFGSVIVYIGITMLLALAFMISVLVIFS